RPLARDRGRDDGDREPGVRQDTSPPSGARTRGEDLSSPGLRTAPALGRRAAHPAGPVIAFPAALLLAVGLTAAASAAAGAPSPRHLIYLHGRIVQEQQNARPFHPERGYYELEKILDTFRSRGFTVTGEIRPRSASVSEAADHVVAQVRRLLESGV